MVTAGRAARLVRERVKGPSQPRPGLYAYRLRPPGGARRVHLRIERDGSGVLLVDVTDAIHLNATAAVLVKLALEQVPLERAAAVLHRRFRGARQADVRAQAAPIYRLVEHLAMTTEDCPTCGLGELARAPLFSTPVHAPYKADVALGYGCNNACGHCYNQQQRAGMRALGPHEWRQVLEKLAAVGVPHVIFTGGEPTLVAELPALVGFAERLGLVTGLNTNGRRLADRRYAESLARAGLSHVQITLQSHRADVHNALSGAASFAETVAGIEAALAGGLHTITNTTLTRRNAGDVEGTVDFLRALGLRTFAMNGMIQSGSGRGNPDAVPLEELAPVLVRVRGRAAELGLRFLWYTPTPYCRLSPFELELGPRRCNAGEYSLCIEPNGDVLPCQSYYAAVGNILRDPWETIWDSPLFMGFRRRVADPRGCGLPQECWDCPELPLCAGGCRLEREERRNKGIRDWGLGTGGV